MPSTGIPPTADLANTYYSQFEDDFVEEGDKHSTDDDADVVTGAQADGDDDNEDTLICERSNKDEEDFINCLEMALDKEEAGKGKIDDINK